MNKYFKLGKIIITEKACEFLWRISISMALYKYIRCNWGIVNDNDKRQNDYAVKIGRNKIFACYRTLMGRKFWIVTENSVTTISLPEENKSGYTRK